MREVFGDAQLLESPDTTASALSSNVNRSQESRK
jgi:hypothetical protein